MKFTAQSQKKSNITKKKKCENIPSFLILWCKIKKKKPWKSPNHVLYSLLSISFCKNPNKTNVIQIINQSTYNYRGELSAKLFELTNQNKGMEQTAKEREEQVQNLNNR